MTEYRFYTGWMVEISFHSVGPLPTTGLFGCDGSCDGSHGHMMGHMVLESAQ